VRYQSLTKHFSGNFTSTSSVIDEVDTALEASFLDVSKTATTTKNLRLDHTAAIDALCNFLCFVHGECNVTDRDGDFVRVE